MIQYKPGKELDVLIAEKVMGWCRLSWEDAYPKSKFQKGRKELTHYWYTKPHPEKDPTEVGLAENSDDYYNPKEAFSPSTNIEEAWQVVEKIDLLSGANLGKNSEGTWGVWFNEGDTIFGESAPHAICLAALKTLK